MAQKRMFSLAVVDTDRFLDMPSSTQSLYYHLGMRADDEGFVSSPKRITKLVGSAEDDLRVLAAKGFIIPFESGVCVITDWGQNNSIKKDRFHPTVYIDERKQITRLENGSYAKCIQDGTISELDCIQDGVNLEPENRLEESSIDKISIEENREEEEVVLPPRSSSSSSVPYQKIVDMYNSTCKSYPKVQKISDARKKAIKARFNSGYTLEDFQTVFELAESTPFLKGKNDRNWRADFDWLIKDSSMVKVLEGKYEDHKKQDEHPPDGTPHPNGGVWMNGEQVW